MKNKFKVGDIVKGKHGNHYCITNEDMIEGEVKSVYTRFGTDMIEVKPLKFSPKAVMTGWITFPVQAKYFELVKSTKDECIVIYRKDDKVYALDGNW